ASSAASLRDSVVWSSRPSEWGGKPLARTSIRYGSARSARRWCIHRRRHVDVTRDQSPDVRRGDPKLTSFDGPLRGSDSLSRGGRTPPAVHFPSLRHGDACPATAVPSWVNRCISTARAVLLVSLRTRTPSPYPARTVR